MPLFRRNAVTAAQSSTSDDNRQKNGKTKKHIAIIGSGVSGLTCAHYLVEEHDVTVFEANDYIGGHVNTIDVALQDGRKSKSRFSKKSQVEKSAIDTGLSSLIGTYPNFFRLLHELQVPFQSTDMGCAVKNVARNFEYNGHAINTLLSHVKISSARSFGALCKIYCNLTSR